MQRVYFDYNIYILLAKGELQLPDDCFNHSKIYISVAHAEEFYISSKKKTIKQSDLDKLYSLFTCKMNNRGILNPSMTRIINKEEKFKDCLQRVQEYDTNNSIEQDAIALYESQSDSYESIKKQDKSSINNSNLSGSTIWERPEVIRELKKCKDTIIDRNKRTIASLARDYGILTAYAISKCSKLKPFDMEKNLFKGVRPHFEKLEFTVEFLQNILNRCGYNRDKDVHKVKSGIYDTEHSIYASYCNFFITNDKALRTRMNAIYYYTGLETQCVSYDEWIRNYAGNGFPNAV